MTDLSSCELLVTCVDSEEAPSGTAFAMGFAKARGIDCWVLDSRSTSIRGSGGYVSSHNLMVDYSMTRRFTNVDSLKSALVIKYAND